MARDVVLLHGFTHTGASWDPVVAALAESYRALAPDIRGHGSASAREPVSLDGVLGDLAELAPDRFTLVGYSMGGRIALHAAAAPALRARIDRVVLIGASPGLADPAERAARRAADDRLADEVEQMTIEEFARRWAQTPVLAGQPPAVAAAVDVDRRRSQPAGLARALRGLGTGALPSLWGRLGELGVPATLIVGERDEKFRAIADEMRAALPEAEVTAVADAGHAVHLEAPERVAELIRRPGG
ncbi:MAG: alpha/beta fold hydrolase [Solirubrobacterales bacterium]|nr:alpha/beta fold hydrolase [Solirubrobacterales bacterium]